MYIVINLRPDVCYSVSCLAQYLSNSNDQHWQAVKDMLRYFKGSLDVGITYRQIPQGNILTGYSNANWASDRDSRHSTSGNCFLLAGGDVLWSSTKQKSVALSSIESEYMALTKATTEAIWLRQFLSNLGFVPDKPTTIFVDNKSAIALANNPKCHSRSKHIAIQYHFICEHLESQTVIL